MDYKNRRGEPQVKEPKSKKVISLRWTCQLCGKGTNTIRSYNGKWVCDKCDEEL